ncbi:MAG: hypothetical protein ABJC13_18445 [Acidobacteriota bacterium]
MAESLIHRKGLVLEEAPIFKLKDWIDRRFLAKYRLPPGEPTGRISG